MLVKSSLFVFLHVCKVMCILTNLVSINIKCKKTQIGIRDKKQDTPNNAFN